MRRALLGAVTAAILVGCTAPELPSPGAPISVLAATPSPAGGLGDGAVPSSTADAPSTATRTATATPEPTPTGSSTPTPTGVDPDPDPTPATTTTTTPPSGPPRCRLADLTAALSAPTADGERRVLRVVWTNSSSRSCTLDGHGKGELHRKVTDRATLPEIERDRPDTVALRSGDRSARPVLLAPGAKAHSQVSVYPAAAGKGGFRPTELRVVPPGETRSAVLRWTGPAVRRADGMGRTLSILQPVTAGAS